MLTINWCCMLLTLSVLVLTFQSTSMAALAQVPRGYEREACKYLKGKLLQPASEHRRRLHAIREQMLIRASLQGPEIDAYILPSYDEHLNEEVAKRDRRLHYLTGFTGSKAFAVITHKGAALWTENRYIHQADGELDCDWQIFRLNETTTIAEWLDAHLYTDMRVGADPHLVPHKLWLQWETELQDKFLTLTKINKNLIDLIWTDRPKPDMVTIQVQERIYAGNKWQDKITVLREQLQKQNCSAMVVTSLTEIAYILNIRGRDIPYTPVVKSYLIVTHDEVLFYVDRFKVALGITLHLRADACHNAMCVIIKEYNNVWSDIRTYAQIWRRVLISAPCIQDPGASEAIFASLPLQIIQETFSPIIFMRAEKNFDEQRGMHMAQIRDGASMCEAMSNLEGRFASELWTEEKIKFEVERSRLSQNNNKGLSLRTVVAFGEHSALPYYISSNVTDIEVTDQNMLVIESGGQYFDGTTDVSRTYHFGEPTAEQRRAYTNVLSGILRLAHLKFPSNLRPAEVDALVRGPVWEQMNDYPQVTGHGIGAYLSVHESPISIAYGSDSVFHFKPGYFFSSGPGYYKHNEFGVRLENVLEVVDTGSVHPSGTNFYEFKDITLVPYEPKLIDGALLSAQEKRYLNEYNRRIRTLVGEELKRQGNMQAFYWMMNKTRHIREYLPEEEYRASIGAGAGKQKSNVAVLASGLLMALAVLASFLRWIL